MKEKFFALLLIVVLLLALGELLLFFNMYTFVIWSFLKSILKYDFISALATLAVGSFAIGLYKKQKNDYKRDVASLIRQEIRYAEQQIRNSQDYSLNAENYPLSCKLLPTNSWYKNIHLFMGDFEQPQIDKISRFYGQVEYIDLVIEKISDYKTSIINQEILDQSGKIISRENILSDRVYLQGIVNLLASQGSPVQNETGQNNVPSQTASGVSNLRQSSVPVKAVWQLEASRILREVSLSVEFIYNTPIGEKFKEIAAKRWIF